MVRYFVRLIFMIILLWRISLLSFETCLKQQGVIRYIDLPKFAELPARCRKNILFWIINNLKTRTLSRLLIGGILKIVS